MENCEIYNDYDENVYMEQSYSNLKVKVCWHDPCDCTQTSAYFTAAILIIFIMLIT